MTRPDVILIRHGRTEWNAAGRFQGHMDPHLDALGRAQVQAAAAEIAHTKPARIISSTAIRALHTADALAHLAGKDVHVDKRLLEVDVGEWGGLTREQVQERFPEEFAAWLAGETVRIGGGETTHEVGERAWACVQEELDVMADDPLGPLVVVTHGGTALSLLVEMLAVPRELRRRFGPLRNAHWSRLAPYHDGWRLIEHNVGPGEVVVEAVAGEVEAVVGESEL